MYETPQKHKSIPVSIKSNSIYKLDISESIIEHNTSLLDTAATNTDNNNTNNDNKCKKNKLKRCREKDIDINGNIVNNNAYDKFMPSQKKN